MSSKVMENLKQVIFAYQMAPPIKHGAVCNTRKLLFFKMICLLTNFSVIFNNAINWLLLGRIACTTYADAAYCY